MHIDLYDVEMRHVTDSQMAWEAVQLITSLRQFDSLDAKETKVNNENMERILYEQNARYTFLYEFVSLGQLMDICVSRPFH